MAELSLKSWSGFPLIVDSQSEPAPTSGDNTNCTIGHRKASREPGEGPHRPRVLAPVDETAGPRSCDWRIGATAAALLLTDPSQLRYVPAIQPTKKPVALLEILIRTICREGGLVGDWFAGSGAVGEACRFTGRRYIGCEIDPAKTEHARARLASPPRFGGGRTP